VLVAVGVGEEEVPVVLGTSMMVPNLMFAKVFLTGEQLARVFRPISLVLVVVASSLLGAWCLGSLLCSKFGGLKVRRPGRQGEVKGFGSGFFASDAMNTEPV
jgi:hypothetical protein